MGRLPRFEFLTIKPNFLAPYRGALLVLCKNLRQWNYWQPILNRETRPILLLADFELPDEIEAPENVTALELNFLSFRSVDNTYLECHFRRVFEYANLFTLLLDQLKPCEVWVSEGCHEEASVLAELAAERGIESVCYQQGWPSVLHTGFRNMEYTRFRTWDERFNELWGRYNPDIIFETFGYPYPVASQKVDQDVTFFLQAPIIISDPIYFDELLQLAAAVARYCADRGDGRTIRIRPHPEWPLSDDQKARFSDLPNVEIDHSMALVDVFARTDISVSIFSSTIVESLAHGTFPVVFDPSLDGESESKDVEFYPSLQEFGLTTHSLPQAVEQLYALLENATERDIFRTNIAAARHTLFCPE